MYELCTCSVAELKLIIETSGLCPAVETCVGCVRSVTDDALCKRKPGCVSTAIGPVWAV
jgi:hypothetical protein